MDSLPACVAQDLGMARYEALHLAPYMHLVHKLVRCPAHCCSAHLSLLLPALVCRQFHDPHALAASLGLPIQ